MGLKFRCVRSKRGKVRLANLRLRVFEFDAKAEREITEWRKVRKLNAR
jgi:hypothetical protein